MAEQIENPEETKLDNEPFPDATDRKRIDHVAEEIAEKASHTEQKYNKEHQIFSK